MAKNAAGRTVVAAMLASCVTAHAQTLADPSPVQRAMETVQFGVPRDAKYIFCEAHHCPERTIKTLAPPLETPVPKPVVHVAPQPVPRVQSVVVPPPELSQAKAAEPKASPVTKKKPMRRKRAVKLDCRPVTAK